MKIQLDMDDATLTKSFEDEQRRLNEVQRRLGELAPSVQATVQRILDNIPADNTSWEVSDLRLCLDCGILSVVFHGYVGGFGSSVNDNWFTAYIDKEGCEVETHGCAV